MLLSEEGPRHVKPCSTHMPVVLSCTQFQTGFPARARLQTRKDDCENMEIYKLEHQHSQSISRLVSVFRQPQHRKSNSYRARLPHGWCVVRYWKRKIVRPRSAAGHVIQLDPVKSFHTLPRYSVQDDGTKNVRGRRA